jgi:hypothetical protein
VTGVRVICKSAIRSAGSGWAAASGQVSAQLDDLFGGGGGATGAMGLGGQLAMDN